MEYIKEESERDRNMPKLEQCAKSNTQEDQVGKEESKGGERGDAMCTYFRLLLLHQENDEAGKQEANPKGTYGADDKPQST